MRFIRHLWPATCLLASMAQAQDASLADFYRGDHPGSFSRGDHFQINEETGDRRTSGSAASMTGIEVALEELARRP